MNLVYLLIIPVILIGVILFVSNASRRLRVRSLSTDIKDLTYQLEENKLIIPYTLKLGYKEIVGSKLNLIPSNLTMKFWIENSEIKREKEEISLRDYIVSVIKRQTIFYSIVIFIIILFIWMRFDANELGMQFITLDNISYELLLLGLDGLTLPFILLIGLIFPLCYLSNWTTIEVWDIYYLISIFAIEYFLIMVFIVIDFTCFYIFFESILPPLFILIGVYGAAQRFRAGYYLFLYTLFGSLFMLVSFMKMGGEVASTFFESIPLEDLYQVLETILWLVLFLSFSVKTPLVPFHIWLPLAHSDANVSGSIILASIVLKLALYGFLRVLIGILVISTVSCNPLVLAMCGISILYSSFTTMRQFDLKVLVAYSSVAHMGSTLLGTFSDTLYGLVGSILFGLAHGLVSPGLFILVGAFLYDRVGTRFINYYRGLTNILPIFALLFLLFIFGNMGVPLTGNFIGEFLSLLGAYQKNIFIAIIGTTSVILSAGYSIFLYNRVASGSLSPYIKTIPDMFRKEFYLLAPLLFLTILLGIYPYFITSEIEFSMSGFLLFTFFPITFLNSNIHSNFSVIKCGGGEITNTNLYTNKINSDNNDSTLDNQNVFILPKSSSYISNKLSKLDTTKLLWSLNIGIFSIDSNNNKYIFLFNCLFLFLFLLYLSIKKKDLIISYFISHSGVINKFIKHLLIFRWLILSIVSISSILLSYIFSINTELNYMNDCISNIISNFNTAIVFFSEYLNCYFMRNYMINGDAFYDFPSVKQEVNNRLYTMHDDNNTGINNEDNPNNNHNSENNNSENNTDNNNRDDRMVVDSNNEEKGLKPKSFYSNGEIDIKERIEHWEKYSKLWREAGRGIKRKYDYSDSDSSDDNDMNEPVEKTKLKNKAQTLKGQIDLVNGDLRNLLIDANEDKRLVSKIMNEVDRETVIPVNDKNVLENKLNINLEKEDRFKNLKYKKSLLEEDFKFIKSNIRSIREAEQTAMINENKKIKFNDNNINNSNNEE